MNYTFKLYENLHIGICKLENIYCIMDRKELSNRLKRIDSVKVTIIDDSTQLLVETDLSNYTINIECEEVLNASFITSPMNENCLIFIQTEVE